jgi:hypothetical protein
MRTLTLADPGAYTWEITQELPGPPRAAEDSSLDSTANTSRERRT